MLVNSFTRYPDPGRNGKAPLRILDVRHLLVIALLAVCGAASARGQAWHTELGIRGGWVRLKQAGTGRPDQIDLIDLPGGDYLGQVQAQSALFLIVPLSGPVALEPSLSLQQNTPSLIVGTMILSGLRADVALPAGWFLGAGGLLRYRDGTGVAMQPGVQLAVGWRTTVLGPISIRAEGQFNGFKKTSQTFAYDAYAFELGLSTRLDSPAPARPRPHPDWEPMIGIAGGYARAHLVGGGDLAVFSAPGIGTGSLAGVFAASPAPFFILVPIRGPLAFEVGLDAHRAQSSPGPTTVFSGQIAPRLDLALGRHWYAAVGGRAHFLAGSGEPVVAVPGVGIAGGYRMDVTPDVAFRIELSYALDHGRTDFGIVPANTLGLTMGLMVAPQR